jgi:thioredoxin-dependent peroxiredoxin
MTVKLQEGDTAPGFALLDQRGNEVRLEDFKGRTVLLYFYPEADTPGCTTQSCSIRDALPDLSETGVDAIGISPDEPGKQLAFDQKYGLGFPLLADTDHAVADAYGAWGEQTYYGKTYEGIIRSSFLIDPDGRIQNTFYRVKAADTVPKAQAALAAKG